MANIGQGYNSGSSSYNRNVNLDNAWSMKGSGDTFYISKNDEILMSFDENGNAFFEKDITFNGDVFGNQQLESMTADNLTCNYSLTANCSADFNHPTNNTKVNIKNDLTGGYSALNVSNNTGREISMKLYGSTSTYPNQFRIEDENNNSILEIDTDNDVLCENNFIVSKDLIADKIGINKNPSFALDVLGDINNTSCYRIDDNEVLTSTDIGSGVVNSSLKNVGNLDNLTINGDLTIDTTLLKVDTVNGRIGIGTNNPQQGLHIKSDIRLGNYNNDNISFVADAHLGFGAEGNLLLVADTNDISGNGTNDIILGYGSAIDTGITQSGKFEDLYPSGEPRKELMRLKGSDNSCIFSTDKIGVNTINPLHVLDVNGNINTSTQYKIMNTNVLTINTLESTVVNSSLVNVGVLDNLVISGDLTVDTSTFKVDSVNNRIGIRTDDPQQDCHIKGDIRLGSNDGDISIVGDGNIGFGAEGNLLLVGDCNDTQDGGWGDIIFGYGSALNTNTNQGSNFSDLYPNGEPRKELMRLKASTDELLINVENVGIGIDIPEQKLHLHKSSTSEACYIKISNDSSGCYFGLSGDENVQLINEGSTKIQLGNNSSVQMTIENDGDVHIHDGNIKADEFIVKSVGTSLGSLGCVLVSSNEFSLTTTYSSLISIDLDNNEIDGSNQYYMMKYSFRVFDNGVDTGPAICMRVVDSGNGIIDDQIYSRRVIKDDGTAFNVLSSTTEWYLFEGDSTQGFFGNGTADFYLNEVGLMGIDVYLNGFSSQNRYNNSSGTSLASQMCSGGIKPENDTSPLKNNASELRFRVNSEASSGILKYRMYKLF